MHTNYEIDKFQRAYFVLPSFAALKESFEKADMAKLIERWKNVEPLDPATV